jgi:MoxR-like ATPase
MSLVRATRGPASGGPEYIGNWIAFGAGPRAGQAMVVAAKARAALDGRTSVTVEDIRAVAHAVLRHRLITTYTAQAEGQTPDSIITKLLNELPVRPSAAAAEAQVAHVFRS